MLKKKQKKTKKLTLLAVIILTLIAIGCKEADTAAVQPATEKALSFGTNCKVTIKSDEAFTAAEWNTLCNKVVAAIEGTRGYNKSGISSMDKTAFEDVFGNRSISVILSSSATYNCEVKSGNYTTIYLKTSAVDTVDIHLAVVTMAAESGSHQN
jgi:alpha-L-arabinofuranosidase